jgi:hypothetical protein
MFTGNGNYLSLIKNIKNILRFFKGIIFLKLTTCFVNSLILNNK